MVLSLVKDIQIVKEAAARITESTCTELVDVRWTKIVAVRNRLVQASFDISLYRALKVQQIG